MKIFAIAAAAAAGLALVMPAAAMDVASVKRMDTPAQDSSQSLQVCAASMSAAAYLAEKDSDDQQLYITLAKAWVTLASKDAGKDYNAYLDDPLLADMQAIYDAGDDVVLFYKRYCLIESKRMLSE